MPVSFPVLDKENIIYKVPIQTKTYFCNNCKNQTNSLRWIEKFRSEYFKCDSCWEKTFSQF